MDLLDLFTTFQGPYIWTNKLLINFTDFIVCVQEKFLKGKGVPNLSKVDVHVICGTVKDFLRSLAQPLVPQSQWQDFTKAAEDQDQEVGQALMIQAISELPQPNRDTLAYLIMHLQR